MEDQPIAVVLPQKQPGQVLRWEGVVADGGSADFELLVKKCRSTDLAGVEVGSPEQQIKDGRLQSCAAEVERETHILRNPWIRRAGALSIGCGLAGDDWHR